MVNYTRELDRQQRLWRNGFFFLGFLISIFNLTLLVVENFRRFAAR